MARGQHMRCEVRLARVRAVPDALDEAMAAGLGQDVGQVGVQWL